MTITNETITQSKRGKITKTLLKPYLSRLKTLLSYENVLNYPYQTTHNGIDSSTFIDYVRAYWGDMYYAISINTETGVISMITTQEPMQTVNNSLSQEPGYQLILTDNVIKYITAEYFMSPQGQEFFTKPLNMPATMGDLFVEKYWNDTIVEQMILSLQYYYERHAELNQ